MKRTISVLVSVLALVGAVTPAPLLAAPPEQADPCSLQAIVEEVGEITHLSEETPAIIIVEEAHNSVLGQLEAAVMLIRLHKRCQLDFVGVEGAFPEESEAFDTTWFQPSEERARLGVAVSLLAEGEISQAEFMALAFPEMVLRGIDDRAHYYHPEEEYTYAALNLLQAISVVLMPTETYREFAEVREQLDGLDPEAPDYEERFDALYERYITLGFHSDPWVSEHYDILSGGAITSITAEIQELGVIIERAEAMREDFRRELNANVDDYIAPANVLLQFYRDAKLRSETMTRQMMDHHRNRPEALLGMMIGAGHTEHVVELFEGAGIPIAVIAPLSLRDESEAGNLSYEAYERKTQALSVDGEHGLGALLDGRSAQIKPPMVLSRAWLRAKALVYLAIDAIAMAAASGERDPEAVEAAVQAAVGGGGLPPYITVHYDTLEMAPDPEGNLTQVIFALTITLEEKRTVTVWVRAAWQEEAEDIDRGDLEDALLAIIRRMREAEEEETEEAEAEPEAETEKRITPNTTAIFGQAQEEVQAHIIHD